MVKELDDAPRDDLAIVLDQDPDGVAGPVGQSSFDAAVRAAGALALAHVLWNRRVVLVGTAPETEDVRIRAAGHDWELALDALATVEPVEGARVDRALRSPSAAITRAREIVVVTGRPDRAVEPLLELRRGGRSVSLVDHGLGDLRGPGTRGPQQPAALRAAAQGVLVAVVTAETPIAEALAGRSAGSGQWLASSAASAGGCSRHRCPWRPSRTRGRRSRRRRACACSSASRRWRCRPRCRRAGRSRRRRRRRRSLG